jgi:hypothetical protein
MSDQASPIAVVLLPSALTTTSSSLATLLVDLHAAFNTIHVLRVCTNLIRLRTYPRPDGTDRIRSRE